MYLCSTSSCIALNRIGELVHLFEKIRTTLPATVATLPQKIDPGIVQNGEDPRPKFATFLELVNRLVNLHQRLLGDVGNILMWHSFASQPALTGRLHQPYQAVPALISLLNQ